MSKVFNRAGVPKVGRSLFNLTHEKALSGQMGYLYPTMYEDVFPGDVFSIGKRITCRFIIPPLAPLMANINVYEHTFFVPYRLLMTEELGDDGDFEDMIIGGSDGDTSITIPVTAVGNYAIGDLREYFGFPPIGGAATGASVTAWLFRAYRMIYNEYYRDIDLDAEQDITINHGAILERRWAKDYFTSARPYQQRGTPPALPLTGTIEVTPDASATAVEIHNGTDATVRTLRYQSDADVRGASSPSATDNLLWDTTGMEVVLDSGAITADVADLRLIFQTQRWMERNMRAGTRYKEVIKSHFNENIGDSRLDSPEYIGGVKVPIIISEVIGNNQDDTVADPGSLAGHAIGVGSKFVGKYRVKEFGVIMSIISVMPDTVYSQGIDRQWRKDTLYDFYWPEFANLSEQAVLTSEIWASTVEATNDTVFGYQGRYNEYRVRQNTVHGELRYGGSLNYWTLAREFASQPTLTSNFVRSRYEAGFEGGIRSDIFPVETGDNLIIRVGNIIKASRPMPLMSNPGLVDHG